MLTRILVALVLLCLWAVPAQATTYYVATDGDNSDPGTEMEPWETIDFAMAEVSCGDLIYVRVGTYAALNSQDTPVRSCLSFESAVTVKAYPGEAVHLDHIQIYAERYLIFDGLTVDGAQFGLAYASVGIGSGFTPVGTGAGYLRFLDMDIHGPQFSVPNATDITSVVSIAVGGVGHNEFIGGSVHDATAQDPTNNQKVHGFYVEVDYNLVQGMEITEVDGYAIQNYGEGAGRPDYNTYTGNFIHHNGLGSRTVGCVTLNSGVGNVASNNLCVWNTNGMGTAGGAAGNNQILNNTIAKNGVAGSGKDGAGCSPQCYDALAFAGAIDIGKNNIVWGNWSDDLVSYGSGLILAGNLCSEAANCDFYTDPDFLNAGGSYLLASDFNISDVSPARDTGVTVVVLIDYTQVTVRPQNVLWDVGAYEYIVGSGPIGVVCEPSSEFALIAHTAAGSNDAYTVSTAETNTTSACLITLAVADESDNTVTVTDTYSNTWNARTAYENVGTGTQRLRFYDCYPCLVGEDHVFTVTFVSGISYPAIAMVATTGSSATPFDQINGAVSASATSRTTGAVVPTQAGEFLVAACSYDANASAAFDGAFTLLNTTAASGSTYGVAMGYLRQTDAASVTGTCTTSVASPMVATMASYKFAYTAAADAPKYRLRRRTQ